MSDTPMVPVLDMYSYEPAGLAQHQAAQQRSNLKNGTVQKPEGEEADE